MLYARPNLCKLKLCSMKAKYDICKAKFMLYEIMQYERPNLLYERPNLCYVI